MEDKKNIEGVEIILLIKNKDDRGVLIETFRIDTLPENIKPEMGYISYTKPGVARGPHEHKEQTDIFSFVGPGTFQLNLWDNRPESGTYKNKMVVEVGEDNPVTVIIPPGIIHGYRNISKDKDGMVLNFPDKLYRGWNKEKDVDEIRHEDDTQTEFKM